MVVLRSTALAAILAAMLVLPVTAQDCGKDCLPQPPSSVQVNVDPAIGQADSQDVAAPGALMPLEAILPMPAPPAQIVPLGGNPSAGAPSFPKLSVPVRYQDSGDVSCGVQALGMALSAAGGSAPTSPALLGFLQGNGMMYDFGTGVEELAFAAQSFGYRGASPFYGGDMSLLQSELAAGRPVVVSLGVNGDGEPGHFVTVTGISPDGGWISYNDPTLGEMVVSSEEFLRLWGLQGYSGVTVAPAIPPAAPDPLPWVALAASAMALVSTTPLGLRRKGIGGRIVSGTTSSSASVSARPAPKPAPKPASKRKPRPKPAVPLGVLREEAIFEANPPPPPTPPIPPGLARAEEEFEGPVTPRAEATVTTDEEAAETEFNAQTPTATPTPPGYTPVSSATPQAEDIPIAPKLTPTGWELQAIRDEARLRAATLPEYNLQDAEDREILLSEATFYYDRVYEEQFGTTLERLVAPPVPHDNPISEVMPGLEPATTLNRTGVNTRFLKSIGLDPDHYPNYDPIYLAELKSTYTDELEDVQAQEDDPILLAKTEKALNGSGYANIRRLEDMLENLFKSAGTKE